MASISEIQDVILTCEICMNIFDKPKLLPCAHTFCEECLKRYSKKCKHGEICCPVCRRDHVIPDGGIEKFKNNFKVDHLLAICARKRKNTKKAENFYHSCEVCFTLNHEKVEATDVCVDCEHLLCSDCVQRHEINVVTKEHTVKPYVRDTYNRSCNIHPKDKIKYFCKTCNTCICMMCSMGE